MTWGFPCFTGETNVLTTEGYKQIKNINTSDRVVVDSGDYRVLSTSKVLKNTVFVESQGILKTETTINHPYYTRTSKKVWDNSKRKYDKVFSEPYWKNAGDLKKSDFITIPKVKDSQNYLYDLTDEELFVIGRYIADGHTSKNYRGSEGKPNNRQWHLILSIGEDKVPKIEAKIKNLHYTLHKHSKSVYRMIFSNKKLVEIVEKECGCGSINKTLSYNILSLPKDKLEIIVDGLMSGDGSFNGKIYRLTTISRNLAQGLCLAVYKIYGTCGKINFSKRPKTTIIENRIVNQHDTYTVGFNKEFLKGANYHIINGKIWLPIKSVKNTSKKCFVYNMEVDKVHIYTANNALVHNCQDISVAGKQRGVKVGTRSGLYYEGYRIIKAKLPKYSIIENVKNLTGNGFDETFRFILSDLRALGYENYWAILNAKDFGVPQNRERVFIVSVLNGEEFVFPEPIKSNIRLIDVLEKEVDEKYYISQEKVDCLINNKNESEVGWIKKSEQGEQHQSNTVYSPTGLARTIMACDYKEPMKVAIPCLTPERLEKRQNGRRFKENGEPMFTLTGQDRHGILVKEATKKGFAIAKEGDSINISQPNSKTRRGRVGEQIANTLLTGCEQVVVEPKVEQIGNIMANGSWGNPQIGRIYSSKGLSPTLDTCPGGGHEPKILENLRIRKLTPLECWRLMGFSDEDFYKAKKAICDKFYKGKDKANSQLYKMDGNSIVVNVLMAILDELFITKSKPQQPSLF